MEAFTRRPKKSSRNTLKYWRRVLVYCVIMAASVVLLTAQSGKITAKDQKAAEAMKAAITALGGEKNLDNVKSLILTGTTKYYSHVAVDDTEIRILLPDNYLRIDKRSGMTVYAKASKGKAQTAGFTETGDRMGTTVRDEVNRFSCLLLGALLKGDPLVLPNLSSVVGTSSKFNIATETGILGEIEFDPKEKYPLFISYKDTVRNIAKFSTTEKPENIEKTPSKLLSANSSNNIRFTMVGPGLEEIVDSIMRFKNRIAVDGIMFPETIVFESRGNAISELKIEKIQINPKLSLADFEIPQSR